MHAQYVFALVTPVVLSIACCVFGEFTHGVHHLLTRMQTRFCAGFALLPQAGLQYFKIHNIIMRHSFVASGCARGAAAPVALDLPALSGFFGFFWGLCFSELEPSCLHLSRYILNAIFWSSLL